MLVVRKEIKLGLGITAAVVGVAVVYGGMALLSSGGSSGTLAQPGSGETLVVDAASINSLDEAVPGLPPAEGSSADVASVRPPINTDPFAETARTDGAPTTDRWATAWNTGRVSNEIAPAREAVPNNPLLSGIDKPIRTPVPNFPGVSPDTGNAASAPAGKYKIQSGDTFSRIAAKLYNDRNLYQVIEKANPGVNPSKLKIGQEINVPAAPPASSSTASARDALTPPAPAITGALDASRQYRIQPGDTLHKISQKLYGKTKFWAALYDANKSAIGPDAGKLRVGTILALPHVPSAD